ncbi:hypothetical protein [Actinomycetospora straminea]|uniref:Uncharacterized protein n=1 Tax=Actinomycetospora straminea TaxID=663607 RepID=A0ABP9DUW2_9PSEU|nr:hypothetical protein [Actinomycetospora straminea]MDD7936298.1 hypothetical protein [Actinomycetospora straminea]
MSTEPLPVDPPTAHGPDDLLRRAAALLRARPNGVLAGPTAAALWIGELSGLVADDDREGGSVLVPGLASRPLEVVVAGRGGRASPGVRVRADRLAPDEVREVVHEGVGRLRLTNPLRTSFDLARTLPLDEAVTVVDAIGARHGLESGELRSTAHRHPGVRGRRAVFPVADLVDQGSTSPARTRVRLAIRRAGIDVPLAGRAIIDEDGVIAGVLDLVWPDDGCGMQVGRTRPDAAARAGRLPELGWHIRLVPDDLSAYWLSWEARGLLAQRRGRTLPRLITRSARRRR